MVFGLNPLDRRPSFAACPRSAPTVPLEQRLPHERGALQQFLDSDGIRDGSLRHASRRFQLLCDFLEERLSGAPSNIGEALALGWAEAQDRIGALIKRGLQKDVDFEKEWPTVLGTLLDKT